MLEIARFDASGCRFPPAKVPVRAGLVGGALTLRGGQADRATVPSQRTFWHFQRGRYALRQAYRMAGVGPGRPLMAPAYHCRTMLDPAMVLSAPLLIYPVLANLQPDVPAIERLAVQARASGQSPAALLVPHYFGIAQPLADLVALCQALGLELIEDCSHALVLDDGIRPGQTLPGIGQTARIGVSSPYKFLPSLDGGLLWADESVTAFPQGLVTRSWQAELRGLISLGREWLQSPLPLPSPTAALWQDAAGPGADAVVPDARPSADYHTGEQQHASLASTRWLMRHTRLDTMATLRRRRYRQWLGAVHGLPGCQPLHAALDETTVPYMFPLLLDDAWPAFHRLKHAGVPIWRWDQMAVSDCAVAASYRLRLLHLPCHQGLTDAQMDWMMSTLAEVMTASHRTAEASR